MKLSGALGRFLIDATGLWRLCNCCEGTGGRYWRGRNCCTGLYENYWIDGDALGDGVTCATVSGVLAGCDCLEFWVDFERAETVDPEDLIDEGIIEGRSCCLCGPCMTELGAGYGRCCCGSFAEGGGSADCEYRITSMILSMTDDHAACGDGSFGMFTKTETFGASGWVKIGLPVTLSGTLHSVTCGGVPFDSAWTRTFRLDCSNAGHPRYEGLSTPWYRYVCPSATAPDIGCLNSGSSNVTASCSAGGSNFTSATSMTIEIRCPDGLSRPCVTCNSSGLKGKL